MTKRSLYLLVFVMLGLSCSKKEAPKPTAMVPEVTVLKVESKDIPVTKEFVGQVAGIKDVEVRARVGGILLKRYYTEGSRVKEGDLLFLIDPEPFKVRVSQAQSVVRIEAAKFENARRSLNRILPLYKQNAVSQKDRDDAVAEYQSSQSALETAKARLKDAQIDLGYTTVRAPISGFTSKETVSEGSLIVADTDRSLLTVISQINPAYVNFTYSESDLYDLRRRRDAGTLIGDATNLRVRLKLNDGSFYPVIGKLNFTDILVDTSTGTIRARALFDNPDSLLKAGQFARVLVEGFQLKNSIMIPQKAVILAQKGPVAFIVDKQSVAQQVMLELGEEIGNDVVVQKGLKSGDLLIVDGAIKVHQGQKVKVITKSGSIAQSKRME
ncbi:efflux RND transporter periplasmic adaptor subunit [Bdellovibrio sp. HCB2-146]|uniref:efflux RND transporter periplasmic adaptor subunit n=1 Tax=Bdellovibrio sp. HCB2-146 TaxID=3394362 RepID=UPI0039BD664E